MTECVCERDYVYVNIIKHWKKQRETDTVMHTKYVHTHNFIKIYYVL